MVTQQTVAPAAWEWLALMPFMVMFVVLFMAFKLASKILEPEVLREVRPIAEEVAMARVGAKALPPGGR